MKTTLFLITIFYVITTSCQPVSSQPLDDQLQINSSSDHNKSFKIWAVLVAGSNGWYNYRHQADVCHAYQVLIQHGVHPDNIIVMMYDDIANNKKNPTPGVIINVPGGKNVYSNVTLDYTGKDVNKKNFIKVLKGDKTLEKKGKKVLKSGPNDHVFIYFSDHGSTGLVAFPRDMLTSSELFKTLNWMKFSNRYRAMTIYLEACESGSMFDSLLPTNMSIFATTAANPKESSYAVYWDDKRETYLGDEYSVNWLIDSDTEKSLVNETLEKQFQIVKQKTQESHPKQYGDHSVRHLSVAQFQGAQKGDAKLFSSLPINNDAVSSHDVPIEILKRRIFKTNDPIVKAELVAEIHLILEARDWLNQTITNVIDDLCSSGYCSNGQSIFQQRHPLINHDDYAQIAIEFHDSCFNLGVHSYALSFMYAFANLIEKLGVLDEPKLQAIKSDLKAACDRHITSHPYYHRFTSII